MRSRRYVRLLALVALLIAVAAAGYFVRRGPGDAPQPGVLQTKIDEPEFKPDASAEDLLKLAQRTADAVVAEYPDDAAAWSVQARRHYLLSETDQATGLWRKSLKLDPTFAEALFGLGLVALDTDRHQDAAHRFEDVARLAPDDPRAPVLYAKSLLLAGRSEDAIVVLEQHLSTQRTSAEAFEMIGQAYLQAQDFRRAAKSFEVAVQAVPDMKDAVFGLSQAYAALGESEQAAAYEGKFRKLAEKARIENAASAKAFEDRDFAAHVAAQTHADAARVHQRHGNDERAEDLLVRAVLLEPTSVEFLAQLQQTLQDRAAYATAAEVGERIVELAPGQLDHWLNLGWLYTNLDQPEQAIAACRKAIELSPDDPRCRQAHEILQRYQ